MIVQVLVNMNIQAPKIKALLIGLKKKMAVYLKIAVMILIKFQYLSPYTKLVQYRCYLQKNNGMCIRSPNKKCQFSHKWLDQC
jgi:hypothetical protein